MKDHRYSPDAGFTFEDPSGSNHDASEVRPGSDSVLTLENISGQTTSVTLTLHVPNNPMLPIKAWQIKVIGNVKLVSLHIKKSVTGSIINLDYLTIGNDNIVHLPAYELDNEGFIDLAELTVIPHSVDDLPRQYEFKVDIVGCGQTGMHNLVMFVIISPVLYRNLVEMTYNQL